MRQHEPTRVCSEQNKKANVHDM